MNWFGKQKPKGKKSKSAKAVAADGPAAASPASAPAAPTPAPSPAPAAAKAAATPAPTPTPTPTPTPVRPKAARETPRAPAFPGFQSTATDEVDMHGADRFTAARLRLRRAFTPAQPINERWLFAGRRGLLAKLIRSIEDERLHTIVYGPRGIGKTSLLHVVAEAARDARYLLSYISCGADATFDAIFRTVAGDIPLMFHEAYGPTSAEAERGGVVADLLGPNPVSPQRASEICAKVVGTRALVIVDEFDRCTSHDFRRDVVEFLKNLSDRSVRVQLVIAGVAENLDDLLESGVLLQRNVVALEVPPMTTDELKDLLGIGQDISGLTFEPVAADILVGAAHGMPYVASLLAQHAALAALADARLQVQAQDVRAAIDEALAQMSGRMPRTAVTQLTTMTEDAPENLLGGLARLALADNGRFTLEDINASASSALEGARLTAFVERMAREGGPIFPVEGEAGRYAFTDASIAPYLWLLAFSRTAAGKTAASPRRPAASEAR